MLQLLWILVAAGAVLVAVLFSASIPYIVAGLLVALFAFWLLVSILWPAVPKRTCPKCGSEGLVKIRRGEPGVRCELCGFKDETLHVAYLDDW
jgi:DNA-directed RNA polymerase subunit RPC12/RpoP